MNHLIDLKTKKIRYWINELPNFTIGDQKIHRSKIKVEKNGTISHNISIALEISILRHISNYGLLGLEYIPNLTSNELEINISYVSQNTEHYQSDISPLGNDYLYKGVHEDYIGNIYEELIKQNKDKELFYPGKINIKVGANCEVGSSPMVFNSLTEMICEILLDSHDVEKRIDIINPIVEEKFINSRVCMG